MRILYVDYYQQDGHVNFNRIHIDALREAGHSVELVLHDEIARQLPFSRDNYALLLPRCLRVRKGKPFLNRIVFLVALLYIYIRVRVKQYDKVFLGCIDEISYSIFPLRPDSFIFAHGNGRFLPASDGSLQAGATKYRAMQRLSAQSTFIVFNDYMAQPFLRARFPHVKTISHGCVPAFEPSTDDALNSLHLAISPDAKLIFHPSGKCNEDFLRQTLADTRLHAFLQAQGIYIILRNRPSWVTEDQVPANIIFVDGFLSNELYRALFLRADAILMCYPASFHHQVSGVSFECAANGKLILALDTPSLSYLRAWFNYDPLFGDTQQLQERIAQLAAPNSSCKITVTPSGLKPDYTTFF